MGVNQKKEKIKMKIKKLIASVLGLLTAASFAACGGEKDILVTIREASSGTREAFDKFVDLDADEIVSTKEELSTTGAVKQKVASAKTAIGYISVASLDDTVKALTVDGVAANVDTVRNGSYKIQRPFLLLTSTSTTLTATAQDFYNYCTSVTAETDILEHGGVTTTEFSTRYEYTAPTTALTGDIVIAGSSSMEKMFKQMIASYKELLGYKADGINFSYSFNGSSEGRSAVKADTNGTTIGLASSSKADTGYNEFTLCLDAVAVIVNNSNDQINNVTKDQLKAIYTGEIKKFSELN